MSGRKITYIWTLPPKSVNNNTTVKKYASEEVMDAFVKNEKVDEPQSRRKYTS